MIVEAKPFKCGNRWYDSVPNLAKAIHLTETLPPSIQNLVARHLNEYIEYYRTVKKNDRHAQSVGVPKVLGLFKAAQKKRWYDPEPDTYRAFNMMATVPEHVLAGFASRVVDIVSFVESRQSYPGRLRDFELVDEVDNILKNTYVTLSEESQSIKLVSGSLPTVAQKQQRHIVSTSRSKKRPK